MDFFLQKIQFFHNMSQENTKVNLVSDIQNSDCYSVFQRKVDLSLKDPEISKIDSWYSLYPYREFMLKYLTILVPS